METVIGVGNPGRPGTRPQTFYLLLIALGAAQAAPFSFMHETLCCVKRYLMNLADESRR